MMAQQKKSYTLDAFPAAAVRFARALDRNNERIAADAGLSESELKALFFIAEHVRVTPKQLSEHMRVTTAAVTFITRRLTDIGMIDRVAHPDDRRSVLLELTPRAHATMSRIHGDFDDMVADATSGLDDDQIEAFTASLTTVAAAIYDHLDRPPGGAGRPSVPPARTT